MLPQQRIDTLSSFFCFPTPAFNVPHSPQTAAVTMTATRHTWPTGSVGQRRRGKKTCGLGVDGVIGLQRNARSVELLAHAARHLDFLLLLSVPLPHCFLPPPPSDLIPPPRLLIHSSHSFSTFSSTFAYHDRCISAVYEVSQDSQLRCQLLSRLRPQDRFVQHGLAT